MSTHPNNPEHERLLAYEQGGRTRRRRAKLFLKYLPRRSNVARFPGLRRLGERARKLPYLWSYKGAPLIRSFYIGSIVSLIPLLGIQLLVGAACAIVGRCNLPIVAALAFVTNPLTSPPIYYGTYRLGRWLLDATGFDQLGVAAGLVPALTVGGVVAGIGLGAALHAIVFFWSRWHQKHAAEIAYLKAKVSRRAAAHRPVPGREESR